MQVEAAELGETASAARGRGAADSSGGGAVRASQQKERPPDIKVVLAGFRHFAARVKGDFNAWEQTVGDDAHAIYVQLKWEGLSAAEQGCYSTAAAAAAAAAPRASLAPLLANAEAKRARTTM